jgi:hypothetical protein
MDKKAAYKDFAERLKLLISKNPALITLTLSNVFTMRLVGNKTHGDLAEIAIAEFINQYMYDFKSIHVGKDLFRAKQSEEDIKIINEVTKAEFSLSLKAYGDGPLQLSTDKQSLMFSMLSEHGNLIDDKEEIAGIMNNPIFDNFSNINVLPLIYDEKRLRCNILVLNYERAKAQITKIIYVDKTDEDEVVVGKKKTKRKHPVYRFYDNEDGYVCEVRYGGATANALQRGLWTNTKNATKYFDSLSGGWIDYSMQPVLVKLLSHALLSTPLAHEAALLILKKDIEQQKLGANLAQ